MKMTPERLQLIKNWHKNSPFSQSNWDINELITAYEQSQVELAEAKEAGLRLIDDHANDLYEIADEGMNNCSKQLKEAQTELAKWRDWQPDEDAFAEAKQQYKNSPEGAGPAYVYIFFLEHKLREAQQQQGG